MLKSLVLFLGMIFATSSFATQPVPGQEYAGPQKFALPELGLSFDMPKGWSGGIPEGQEIFLMALPGTDGFIFLSANEFPESQIVSTMSGNIPLDEGIVLVPKQEAKKTGKKIVNTFTVMGTELEAHGIATIGGHGVSFIALAVGTTEALPLLTRTAENVSKSVKLEKRKKPAAPVATKGGAWDTKLRGKRLLRFYSGSGYSERESYDLCADGSFYRHFSGGGTTQLGSGNIRSNKGGAWSIQGDMLSVRSSDGESWAKNLGTVGNEFRMDGDKWFIEGPAKCQ